MAIETEGGTYINVNGNEEKVMLIFMIVILGENIILFI